MDFQTHKDILKLYYQDAENVTNAIRAYSRLQNVKSWPFSYNAIKNMIK